MILGNLCTRACPFCDVEHGKPFPPDPEEPVHLAEAVKRMNLRHVVITSVDRDDLSDGGSRHFTTVVEILRQKVPSVRIELLVPDFRGCLSLAVETLSQALPDVLNHNIETVPRLYRKVRPGADYRHSLNLLSRFRQLHPFLPTKSGLMLGLGETEEEIASVLRDLRSAGCSMLTIGQYLPPSKTHLPVERYVTPEEFADWDQFAHNEGFRHVASGPLVRSSYHAEENANGLFSHHS